MTTLRSGFRSLLAVPVVAVVFLFGVWVGGVVVSNDFKTSMALTAAWFLLSAVVCLLVARRSRALRVAVLGTYIVTAGRSAPTSA
jgi:xanthosine utilization system XapX-like protein